MAEERVQRRLAANLATDIAGYSRLMGADEEGTLAQLKALRKSLIDPKIGQYHGRIVKTTGDGALVEFASALDAVRCGVEIQRSMADHNTDTPDDRRIEFRIGINVGDIIIDEGDIYGDGVNIAARLEILAKPGSLCLTANAYQQIKGKLALAIPEHERRSGAGIFCRRYGRGHHHRALAHQVAVCHRSKFGLRIQGQSRRREADREGVGRTIRARRKR